MVHLLVVSNLGNVSWECSCSDVIIMHIILHNYNTGTLMSHSCA